MSAAALANVDEESTVGQALRAVGGVATELFEAVAGPSKDKRTAAMQMSAATAEAVAEEVGQREEEQEEQEEQEATVERADEGDIFSEEEEVGSWERTAAAVSALAAWERKRAVAAVDAVAHPNSKGVASLVAEEAAKWAGVAARTREGASAGDSGGGGGAVAAEAEDEGKGCCTPVRGAIAAVDASCEELVVRQREAAVAEVAAAAAAEEAGQAAAAVVRARAACEPLAAAAAAAATRGQEAAGAAAAAQAAAADAQRALAASQVEVDGLTEDAVAAPLELGAVRAATLPLPFPRLARPAPHLPRLDLSLRLASL